MWTPIHAFFTVLAAFFLAASGCEAALTERGNFFGHAPLAFERSLKTQWEEYMKRLIIAASFAAFVVGPAVAQSMNKSDDKKQQSPGATGAMQNAPANGVATDPQQVQQQQGDKSKSSPGTVGAAPGADTKSQSGK